MRYVLLAITLIFLLATNVCGQDAAKKDSDEKFYKQEQARKSRNSDAAHNPKLPSRTQASDDATEAKKAEALQASYDYSISALEHRKLAFRWQLYSSMAIFVIAIILVSIGVYFSWMHFNAAIKNKKGSGGEAPTNLKVSKDGIEVSSPILGVIIMVISLAFFYMYLVYVYPIEIVK